MCDEAVEQNSSQDLACDGQQEDSTMIVAGLAVSFAFVEVYDGGVLEVLWHCLVLPDELKQLVKFLNQEHTTLFVDLSWDGV